ncbi:DivIVA domain-containing protein [Streptomyces boninensis]|uniref:DivIVA domain-containing protein n=1 Tax=Streptomyces boninensis TaxID=2039455 RepID=UPI003B21A463
MLLTPDDVHHQWFDTVRLREGYEMGAVDTFLKEVEYTIDQLYKQVAALRETPGTQSQSVLPESRHAARIIALADHTAQQTTEDARAEAQRIIAEAHTQAAAIERDARLRAERMEGQLTNMRALITEYRERLAGDLDTHLDDIEQLHSASTSRSPLEHAP